MSEIVDKKSQDNSLLKQLLLERQEKMSQIQQLKQNYLQKQVRRSDFYAEYEHLGKDVYQINREIYNIDPNQCITNNF